MTGLFAFVDQIMMVKLIPSFLTPEHIYGKNIFDEYTTICNNHPDVNLMNLSSTSIIIRTSVAYTAPITVFINAAALLLGQGTAINYSKYSGAKNEYMTEKT
jgi:Na+-driven multidrug efflux pump